MSLQAVSRHIQVLVRAGLVTQERTGRIARCSIVGGADVWRGGLAQPVHAVLAAVVRYAGGNGEGVAGDGAKRKGWEGQAEMSLRENPRIVLLEKRLREARVQLHEALAETAQGEVKDYSFSMPDGEIRLSALFGGRRDLFVIHNMGTGCAQCTMWADGFNGFYPHLAARAAAVVVSPDPPQRQAEFAAARGWRFPMASSAGTTFAADMGFADAQGRTLPGVSVFQREARASSNT